MGRPPGWAADATGRPAMRSPGRPPMARREDKLRFWEAITRGLSSEDAGVQAGVSPAVGTRWFREAGGMPPISLAPLSGRYLSFAEREETAILRARGHAVREIARQLSRSPSTVSRELRRNGNPRRPPALPGHDRAVARRPTRSTPEASQARRTRTAAALCAGPTRRHGRDYRRHAGARPERAMDWPPARAPARAPAGPSLGTSVEPRADRQPVAGRLPG